MSKENTCDCLGAVIKTARQAKGLTQTQLAETLRITARHLKAIENSGQNPSYDLFVRIIRKLDISADTVFYPDGQKIQLRSSSYGEDENPDRSMNKVIRIQDDAKESRHVQNVVALFVGTPGIPSRMLWNAIPANKKF